MTAPREQAIDVARFLKLTGRGAHGILALFLVTQCVLALGTLGGVRVPWVSIAALVLVIAGAIIVMRPGASPLSGRSSGFVLGSVIVSTVMVSWNLPTQGWPGYASWHLGANTFVLMALGLRGRIGMSWVGMGAMAAISVAWAVNTGQSVLEGIDLVDRHAGTLLIGTVFAIALHRTAEGIAKYHAADRRRVALAAETAAGEQERHRQAARLHTEVEPVLELIAADELSDEQRDRMRVLEASLRDEIRAGSLLREPLVSSVQRARERGIDLLLLDDSGGALLSDPILRDAIAWAAGAVDSLERGRVVIRLPPPRDKRIASIHIEDDQHSRAIEFPTLSEGVTQSTSAHRP